MFTYRKLVSTFASTFTAYYQFYWHDYFPDQPLVASMLPSFDARAVQYPSLAELRDYFSWRQADCKFYVVVFVESTLIIL